MLSMTPLFSPSNAIYSSASGHLSSLQSVQKLSDQIRNLPGIRLNFFLPLSLNHNAA
jgi:hypothetical protein